MKRRLAAILVGDIVGFSGLMEADEEGTARRLAACRRSIDEEIAKCGGRLFKAMGDAVLVEFESPIEAVRCAVDIRTGLALAALSEDRPFRMRFGLHLADVLVEGDDLIGDGVNLAARIQQAAEANAIDVSGALFEQIRRTSPFAFDDRGEQTFKNIGEPIRVYRLRGERARTVYQIASTQPQPVKAKQHYFIEPEIPDINTHVRRMECTIYPKRSACNYDPHDNADQQIFFADDPCEQQMADK